MQIQSFFMLRYVIHCMTNVKNPEVGKSLGKTFGKSKFIKHSALTKSNELHSQHFVACREPVSWPQFLESVSKAQ